MKTQPSIAILLVNYRGWNDTIECLESLFRIDYPNYRIVVVDNDSRDGSLDKIALWAKGKLNHFSFPNHPLHAYTSPPVTKPISYSLIVPARNTIVFSDENNIDPQVTLIQSDANRGYAAGNNLGLRYLLENTNSQYVWFLNNDTVVKPDALTKLLERFTASENTGICGSTLLYYDAPDIVQARAGAWYRKWFAYSKHIGVFEPAARKVSSNEIEPVLAYVSGASMLVSRQFIEQVGFLSEDYFLYFEEIDWATRGKRFGFKLRYAPDSVVYHKEGSITGANNRTGAKTQLTDFYGQRNRILFTKKFFPYALPTVWLAMLASAVRRLLRGDFPKAWQLIRILFGARKPM